MRTRSWSFLARSSFLHQLALTFSIGIICLALISSIAISTLSSQTVQEKLVEQGLRATDVLSEQSVLALLYLSSENATEPLAATLGFPDVVGAGIYDTGFQALATKGDDPLPQGADALWPDQVIVDRETSDAWYFVAPVYAHRKQEGDESPFGANRKVAEKIGYVRVKMGKETMATVAANIRYTNLVVSVGLALVLLSVLLAITKRLTTPLKNLANIMGKASEGEKNLRADVRGPKDIIDMEKAFNTMMGVLETRELQLENTRDAALESARLKGEFAANVSHELRTPLNGVLGMLELLQAMGLTPKQQEYAEVAHGAGESLLKLIDDILDFSRTDSGKLKLAPIDFDLAEMLDEIVGLVASQAQRKDVEMGYWLADQVPDNLYGDPARIRQVLVNLVGNAVKFSEGGVVEIGVTVESPVTGSSDMIRFEVRDTGIGIPPEAHQRIFEPFTQADGSTTRNYGGAGLGLAICRKLVHFMGGDIGVESRAAQGSTFWFVLPLKPSERSPWSANDRREALAGLKLLLVDDNPVVRRLLAQLAKYWGAAYRCATNGFMALQMLQTDGADGGAYDAVVVDEFMPGIGGLSLAKQMAADHALRHQRVILLTSHPQGIAEIERPTNVLGVIPKPVRAQSLYDCLIKINQSRTGRSSAESNLVQLRSDLNRRVLVAEDNRASQQVAMGMLERLGCTARIAGNGREALALVQKEAFDLVLMDCHMPQMDGYEATRQIRGLSGRVAEIPVIAMTANTQAGDSEACIAAGMDDYLPKPLKLDLLRDKLCRWSSRVNVLDPSEANADEPRNLGSAEPGQDSADTIEAHPAGEIVSEAVLQTLRDETGDAFAKVVDAFLEDAPGYLQTLEEAVNKGDRVVCREVVHCLKGSSRTLGANGLAGVAQEFEQLSTEEEFSARAPKLLARLKGEFRAARTALEHRVESGSEETAEDSAFSPRILVADDDRAMRFALLNVLQRDGYQIEQATNGIQAVSLCERTMPDLVLMDARMPRMDGFTACSKIRELPGGAAIPVLIITALDDEQSIDRAFSAGATDYIPKPVHFAVLRQRVARMLEASRAQQHVTRLAYHDALTGLPNRTMFREQLDAVLTGKQAFDSARLHAVLFLDLDRFKLANDTMGHEVGDLLLKAAAGRIQESLRAGDLVSRFGGDEFTVFLANLDSPERAAILAERVCKSISKPFTFNGRELYLSTSIGIALYPNDGLDSAALIKHADLAMFRAKERGNTYRFFEDGMASAISTKLKLESDLRRALEHKEFRLHYQPKVDLSTGAIIGVEALVRWQHPDFGLVPPAQFISLAEETGLIDDLGEWVLLTACGQTKAWHDKGLPEISVAINLSARQLETDFETRVVPQVLRETGLDPSFLELELTESVVMKDPSKTRDILRRLKERGISISIDDFGTGYSSLNQLKHFAFVKLKIDKAFIRDVDRNPEDAGIVLTIIAMARTLKLRVIAEGIETQEQLRYLQRNGCDEGQGYFFSKPLPPEGIALLLQRQRTGCPYEGLVHDVEAH